MPLEWNGSFWRLLKMRSVFSSNAISCRAEQVDASSSARMRSSAAGSTSGSILSGHWPSRPHSTALSVPWPRPVSASEPNSSARTRRTRSRMPVSRQPAAGEARGRAHRPDRVRGARADADLEEVENADGHARGSTGRRVAAILCARSDPAFRARMRLILLPARRLPALRPRARPARAGARAGVRERVGSTTTRRSKRATASACRCCATRTTGASWIGRSMRSTSVRAFVGAALAASSTGAMQSSRLKPLLQALFRGCRTTFVLTAIASGSGRYRPSRRCRRRSPGG